MSEAALWSTTRDRLSRYGLVKRLENSVEEGWSDVVYCLRPSPVRDAYPGWLELKHLPTWPARASTSVVIDHLTREQVLFMESWVRAGGQAHVLLQVSRTYLLLDVTTVRQVYRRELNRRQVLDHALVVGEGRFPTRELVACLTQS